MDNKPNLILINTRPIDDLPMESLEDFKHWVLKDDLKPSIALHKLMDKYNCPKINVSTVVQLLRLTFPKIDIGAYGYRNKIIDSAYPNSDPDQFCDDDFDKGIEELLSLPNGGW